MAAAAVLEQGDVGWPAVERSAGPAQIVEIALDLGSRDHAAPDGIDQVAAGIKIDAGLVDEQPRRPGARAVQMLRVSPIASTQASSSA